MHFAHLEKAHFGRERVQNCWKSSDGNLIRREERKPFNKVGKKKVVLGTSKFAKTISLSPEILN